MGVTWGHGQIFLLFCLYLITCLRAAGPEKRKNAVDESMALSLIYSSHYSIAHRPLLDV